MIRFQCPGAGCAMRLKVGPEQAGRTGRCPKCGAMFVVPFPVPDAPPLRAEPAPVSKVVLDPEPAPPTLAPILPDRTPFALDPVEPPAAVAKRVPADWEYADAGGWRGPFTRSEMRALIAAGSVGPRTLVRRDAGTADRALDSLLADDFSEDAHDERADERDRHSGRPAPNPVFAWLLVAVPFVGAVIESNSPRTSPVLAYIAVNWVLSYLDGRQLKAVGMKVPSAWWASLLVPVYLWRRSALNRLNVAPFWAWVAAFVLSVALAVGGSRVSIEDQARPLVTQIVRDQWGWSSRCVRVVLGKRSANEYRGYADLSNGTRVLVLVETDGDMIYVTATR